jgi:peptidyl-tRNA hydrolase
METADYVLSPFLTEERAPAAEAASKAAEAVLTVITQGLTRAMNLFNQK